MKLKNPILISIATLAALTLACVLLSPDVTPKESTSQGAPRLLFQDDFSDPASGWGTLNEETGTIAYDQGGLRIQVNAEYTDLWSTPGLEFDDVRLEVDAKKLGGPDDNDFGAICRYNSDTNDFYFFIISSDGYYGIGKYIAGSQELIDMDALLPSDTIHQGNTTNHIRATCLGDQLTLHINGRLVKEVQDSTLSSGSVGVMAGTYAQPGTDILFDNFTVLQP
jgi:hypothetical protein